MFAEFLVAPFRRWPGRSLQPETSQSVELSEEQRPCQYCTAEASGIEHS